MEELLNLFIIYYIISIIIAAGVMASNTNDFKYFKTYQRFLGLLITPIALPFVFGYYIIELIYKAIKGVK